MTKLTKVKLKDIKVGQPQNVPLPEGSVKRILEYKKKLSEVETSSLEMTLLNFQRDLFPEREVEVWEWIAENYKLSCKANPGWNLVHKKECFKHLLNKTLGKAD